MLEEPTMWWFAALLFLLGFSTPGHYRHPGGPGNTASSTRTVIMEAATSTR